MTRGPRFGLLVDTDALNPAETEVSTFARHIVDMGVAAEASGFDGVFLPDRHMRPTTLAPNQLVNATAIAVRTEAISVGSYCSVLPLYHPMHFAEGWAHLDQLSGGRAIVAVGAGYNDDYLRCFGLPRSGFRRRFREATAILKRAWADQLPWSFHGDEFDLTDVALLPGPYRPGGPPLWIAGQADSAVAFAAQAGDGFAGDPFPITAEAWARRVTRFRDGAAARGVDAPDVALLRHVFVTDSPTEARQVVNDVCLPQFRFYEHAGLLNGRLPDGVAVDERVARETAIAGSASECAERLCEVVDRYALTYLIVKVMRPAGLDPVREIAMVDELGSAVVASVRRAICST